jgi:hypothetical protein
MSGVFQNVDPPPHPRTASVNPPLPPAFGAGEDKLAGWKGGGSIFLKMPDTALYSTIYIRKYFVVETFYKNPFLCCTQKHIIVMILCFIH